MQAFDGAGSEERETANMRVSMRLTPHEGMNRFFASRFVCLTRLIKMWPNVATCASESGPKSWETLRNIVIAAAECMHQLGSVKHL